MSQNVELKITGKVQGVGFRPFIFNLAKHLGLKGEVWNDSAGVTIRLFRPENLPFFLTLLREQLPPLAVIDEISQTEILWEGAAPADFTIKFSQSGQSATEIIPDITTCTQCLAEMNDPKDRRYRYPFINCTHCGPRFTIIKKMPYDRPDTCMAKFPLCKDCAAEYADPTNRRFHAQPLACPSCGPEIYSISSDQNAHILKNETALYQAIETLKEGKIIAIKGLGGFHLACLATNDQAVARLRERKNRPSKPFAVMIPDISWLQKICDDNLPLSEISIILKSPAAPITLIKRHKNAPLSALIAPKLNEIGLMLPANPLQHLLLQEIKSPLVMTSGNGNGLAPALSNEEALIHLKNIADLFLLHDRDILERADDSILRLLNNGEKEILRRGRGLSPDSFPLPRGFPTDKTILALGGDLKNSFCLLHQHKIFTGSHFGDLNKGNVFEQWEHMLQKFPALYHAQPELIACDAHPSYRSHHWASQQELPYRKIYHHHAHIAACLGEKNWPLNHKKIIAMTLDGLGYGMNGKIWGGECFLANYNHFEHLGGLPSVPLPGGDLAAKQPWRNLLAQFETFVPNWENYPENSEIKKYPYKTLIKAIKAGINSPLSSSCGRLFEAVAAALQIAPQTQSYEGEAACFLENLANQTGRCEHPLHLPLKGNQLDLALFWQDFLNWNSTKAKKAWAFHDALAKGFAELAKYFAQKYKTNHIVLSGGCLHNQLLKERLTDYLFPLKILTHSELPSGDGGIAFGQALIALASIVK